MAFSKHVTTNAGRDLLLSCMATGDFQIHSLVLGSGEYGGILTEIRDVVEPVISCSGEDLVVSKRGEQLELRCRLSNEHLEKGFDWREYGVYATNGTETVLYCYDNAGDDPIPITAASTGTGISNTIKVLLSVAEAATVNVNFVTESGTNAVTGTAVWKFAGGGIPTPTPEDAGKFLRVDAEGVYALEAVPNAEEASF